jgi:hypothetical protein
MPYNPFIYTAQNIFYGFQYHFGVVGRTGDRIDPK